MTLLANVLGYAKKIRAKEKASAKSISCSLKLLKKLCNEGDY